MDGDFSSNMANFMGGLTGDILKRREEQRAIKQRNEDNALRTKLNLFSTMITDPDQYGDDQIRMFGGMIGKDKGIKDALGMDPNMAIEQLLGTRNQLRAQAMQNQDFATMYGGVSGSMTGRDIKTAIPNIYREKRLSLQDQRDNEIKAAQLDATNNATLKRAMEQSQNIQGREMDALQKQATEAQKFKQEDATKRYVADKRAEGRANRVSSYGPDGKILGLTKDEERVYAGLRKEAEAYAKGEIAAHAAANKGNPDAWKTRPSQRELAENRFGDLLRGRQKFGGYLESGVYSPDPPKTSQSTSVTTTSIPSGPTTTLPRLDANEISMFGGNPNPKSQVTTKQIPSIAPTSKNNPDNENLRKSFAKAEMALKRTPGLTKKELYKFKEQFAEMVGSFFSGEDPRKNVFIDGSVGSQAALEAFIDFVGRENSPSSTTTTIPGQPKDWNVNQEVEDE